MSYLNQLGSSSAELTSGIRSLGLEVSDVQLEQLAQYATLLQKWGSVYNLTANKEPSQIVTLHLLDSLSVIAPLCKNAPNVKDILDVGSGAGLPGVVLAIMLPSVQVQCLDAVAKKAAFIRQISISLGLSNLLSHHSRIEDHEPQFDVITSRAFSSLTDFVNLTQKNLKPHGIWLAMKGVVNEQELAPVLSNGKLDVFHVEQLRVPGLDASRNIVWVKRRL